MIVVLDLIKGYVIGTIIGAIILLVINVIIPYIKSQKSKPEIKFGRKDDDKA